jgi:hypothetical protein
LALLSPPMSFSSVISTMIGQHPEAYGFPELHLNMGDTVADVLEKEERRGKRLGAPGLLRALAEIVGGRQDEEQIEHAHAWLTKRRDWSTKQVFDFLLDRVGQSRRVKICVEKSPPASRRAADLERLGAFYPDALFLHISRHPLATVNSYQQHVERVRRGPQMDLFAYWQLCHDNIIAFTDTVPAENVLRIRGEDFLSEPRYWLRRVCDWAGLDDSNASIEAMMRPEESPYAAPGPFNARGGNNRNFLKDPKLRPFRKSDESLRQTLANPEFSTRFTAQERQQLLDLNDYLGYD